MRWQRGEIGKGAFLHLVAFPIGFPEKDGRWRRVKVEVKKIRGMPRLRSHYRLGYYAPTR